jgi:hypothetical protein
MAGKGSDKADRVVPRREGVVKFTKPPDNKVPPSQR